MAKAAPSQPAPSAQEKRWIDAAPSPEERAGAEALARDLALSPLLAGLLAGRGVRTAEEGERFLDPRLQSLSDPFRLTDLRAAAERVVRAVAQGEKIAVFGDYDVDGITSTALLTRFLGSVGGKVAAFLPRRLSEGYGLTRQAAERCLAEASPRLLIAVDCGTSSPDEVAWLREQGVETVILDHHELPSRLPRCEALVNPHRDGHSEYLASVGLAFKLAHALLKLEPRWRERVDLKAFLPFVAMGTVSDLAPLQEENRVFVRHGLLRLEKIDEGNFEGIRALVKVSGIRTGAGVTAEDIGFRLGPRINASGRIDDASESLRLLLTDDPSEAERIARSLDGMNRERQDLEQKTLDEATAMLAEGLGGEPGVILGKRGWHPGVIGIVASRIQKMTGRPAIVIGFDEAGDGKGSGRSVEGCSLVEGLRGAHESLPGGLLDRYGGHEMAAGLSLRVERLEAFRTAFNEWMRAAVSPEALRPRLRLDGELPVSSVGESLFREIGRLAPFGRGNVQPLFAFRRVLQSRPPQRIKEKHLKLFLASNGSRGGEALDAIAFGFGTRTMPAAPLSLAGSLEWDDYKGRVQIRVVDWRGEG
ncbi:exonuclease RecJ [Verrucomicrobium sp. GAS474]|uniref:single-stranded-DNA-specific exonuclease RecJ n=1 Tax=Verrucomicrobium sp. GAS474 TaxID=1882831 RepID=UPI00087BE9D1|nr:single-stranded-DNA-specific exonuclease RecJ [Verrucomicrobium sp. GAS474]SDT86609.1 exonuclease RecJ [Verrucomicrobium sp. GAS474]